MVKRYVLDKVCKKCQTRTWLMIFFIEDKYVAHESTSPKTYFIDGRWCHCRETEFLGSGFMLMHGIHAEGSSEGGSVSEECSGNTSRR